MIKDRDMARETLSLLHRLEDFEEMCSKTATLAGDKERIQLQNVRGCIEALRYSIRNLRNEESAPKSGRSGFVRTVESGRKSA